MSRIVSIQRSAFNYTYSGIVSRTKKEKDERMFS